MASRRSYGAGSVSKKKGGGWLVRIELGDDPLTGERRRISRTVHGTKTEAQRVLDGLKSEYVVTTGRRTVADLTLRELVTRWRASADHAEGTRRNYDLAFTLVPDHLMDSAAHRLTNETLDQLYAALRREGAAPDRIRYLHAGLGATYTAGVRWNLVRTNPAKDTKPPPKPVRKKRQQFDATTPARLLAGCSGPAERAWIAVHVATGARKSEVLALRWGDVDLEAGTIWITEALDPVADGAPRKDTKAHDRRLIPIFGATTVLLDEWWNAAAERAEAVGVVLEPGASIFSDDPAGAEPWDPKNTSNRFGRLRARAGVTGLSLHGLRHMVVTLAQSAGVTARAVGEFVGQRNIQTTMGYTGAMPERGREIAGLLDSLLDVRRTE
jgi:integrase